MKRLTESGVASLAAALIVGSEPRKISKHPALGAPYGVQTGKTSLQVQDPKTGIYKDIVMSGTGVMSNEERQKADYYFFGKPLIDHVCQKLYLKACQEAGLEERTNSFSKRLRRQWR